MICLGGISYRPRIRCLHVNPNRLELAQAYIHKLFCLNLVIIYVVILCIMLVIIFNLEYPVALNAETASFPRLARTAQETAL